MFGACRLLGFIAFLAARLLHLTPWLFVTIQGSALVTFALLVIIVQLEAACRFPVQRVLLMELSARLLFLHASLALLATTVRVSVTSDQLAFAKKAIIVQQVRSQLAKLRFPRAAILDTVLLISHNVHLGTTIRYLAN
jgi:hypothetical protein